MKVMIMVDVPDDIGIEELEVSGEISTNRIDDGWLCDLSMCPLRPMPMKKASLNTWFAFDKPVMYTYNPNDYDKGWNDCVDFLEGEWNE